MTDIEKNGIENLCFFRQKIIDNSHSNLTDEYELLLRQEQDNRFIFPEELFYKMIVNKDYHSSYLEHINPLLYSYFEKSDAIYSLNVDYQELYYPETIEFLKNFKYKKRLKIELTERIPLFRDNPYKELVPIEVIKAISSLGYTIVFDDFLSGVNTFETLFTVEPYISRIKISVLPFKKNLSTEELRAFIFAIVETIHFLGKEIVIEGVEEEELLNYFPEDWKQQTYFYDFPHKF
ncbi:EAL domain-containing protein [Lactococcus petauri]|uniref:EAL domain-containing protein n=1 Tax=Lactococcus petauri TaxID=1940789 RepID=UPI0013FD4F3C|nr:EAL domain-containing protein [Lactococcus petauri]NHI76139.1 EAL domain-containing protein [Lactococcus petauri]